MIFNTIIGGSLDVNISRRRILANGTSANTLVIEGITNEENILAFVLCCLPSDNSENRPFYVICKDGIESIYKAGDEYYGNTNQHTVTTNYTLKNGVLTLNGLGLGLPSVLLTIYKLI